jgi:hypothetical protein
MESLKFIDEITSYVDRNRIIIGDCVYYNLENGNKVKIWCDTYGVCATVINKTQGSVDRVDFPFRCYFAPVQCSKGAPTWTQHIDHGHWYFDNMPHVLPKHSDFCNLALALTVYIDMYA